METYSIRRGDTLSAIASRYGTSAQVLARQNGITNPNMIQAGQSLRVPARTEQTPGRQPTGHSMVDSFEPAQRQNTSGVRGSRALAETARRNATARRGGHCARGVENTLRDAMGVNIHANANRLDNQLPRNRFREVNMPLEQALRTPGLVLTWERSNHSQGGLRYGHTAITSGDGRTTYSDIVDHNTTGRGRTGLRVFEPINA
jgi:LysM repeat protein